MAHRSLAGHSDLTSEHECMNSTVHVRKQYVRGTLGSRSCRRVPSMARRALRSGINTEVSRYISVSAIRSS